VKEPGEAQSRNRQPERQKHRSPAATAGDEEEERAGKGPDKKKKRLDPEVEAKKREKEALLRELKDLESDVAQCTDRIQNLHDPDAPKILNPVEQDNLM
jgi:hypothetical protein